MTTEKNKVQLTHGRQRRNRRRNTAVEGGGSMGAGTERPLRQNGRILRPGDGSCETSSADGASAADICCARKSSLRGLQKKHRRQQRKNQHNKNELLGWRRSYRTPAEVKVTSWL